MSFFTSNILSPTRNHSSQPPSSRAHLILIISRLSSSPSTFDASIPPTLSTISSSHFSSPSCSSSSGEVVEAGTVYIYSGAEAQPGRESMLLEDLSLPLLTGSLVIVIRVVLVVGRQYLLLGLVVIVSVNSLSLLSGQWRQVDMASVPLGRLRRWISSSCYRDDSWLAVYHPSYPLLVRLQAKVRWLLFFGAVEEEDELARLPASEAGAGGDVPREISLFRFSFRTRLCPLLPRRRRRGTRSA